MCEGVRVSVKCGIYIYMYLRCGKTLMSLLIAHT